jgi:hypothetical protein
MSQLIHLKHGRCSTIDTQHGWEHRLHDLLGVPLPCEATSEFWALWPEVIGELQAKGIRVGPRRFTESNEDLEVQVDRKDLAGRAGLSKQGPLVVPAKVASTGSRRNARRTLTCLSANSKS